MKSSRLPGGRRPSNRMFRCSESFSEAWREGRSDYATVAMKFALKDSMVERASGRTIEGGDRTEVTELWTFMRARGGNWLLSALQQT